MSVIVKITIGAVFSGVAAYYIYKYWNRTKPKDNNDLEKNDQNVNMREMDNLDVPFIKKDELSGSRFKKLSLSLKKIYINNFERNSGIVFFVVPSMIQFSDNEIKVIPYSNEEEYFSKLQDLNYSEKLFVHPRLSLKERQANLYIAYSIGALFLKYHLNKSNDEIREFTNNQLNIENQVFNEFLINSFNINQKIAVEYINNLDALCESLEKDLNLNDVIIIPNKAQNDKFNNDDEIEGLNIRQVNHDDKLIPVKDPQPIIPVQNKLSIQVQDPNLGCCPHCKSNYLFEGGCNFITCESQICKRQKYFCHLCKKKLHTTEKISHFPNGIYKDCLNVKL